MAGDRVELVRSYFAGLERGDEGFEESLELLTDDFELDYTRSRGPAAATYRGRDGIRDWYRTIMEVFELVAVIEREVLEVGDKVVRVGGFRARGQGSGIEVEAVGATIFEFRGDQMSRAVFHQSKEEALASLD